MKTKTKVLTILILAIASTFSIFAKAPSPEKIKEFIKLSGGSEIIAVQGKIAAEMLRKEDPKKSLKTLTKERVESFENFFTETIATVSTEEELDKAILHLKTDEGKDFVKLQVKITIKNIDRIRDVQKASSQEAKK